MFRIVIVGLLALLAPDLAFACPSQMNVGRNIVAVCVDAKEVAQPGALCVNGAPQCIAGELRGDVLYFSYRARPGDVIVYQPAEPTLSAQVATVPSPDNKEQLERVFLVLIGGLLTMLGGVFSGWGIGVWNDMRAQRALVRDWRDRQVNEITQYRVGHAPKMAVAVPGGLNGTNFDKLQAVFERLSFLERSVVLAQLEKEAAVAQARAEVAKIHRS